MSSTVDLVPGTTYTLPDIIAYCPFVSRISPHYPAASIESDAWFDSYHVHEGAQRTAFYAHRFGYFVCMIYPDADYVRLRNCCDFMSMLYAFDDLTDDGGLRGSMDGARQAGELVMLALKYPNTFKTEFKPAEILRDIWERISADTAEAAQGRFIEATQVYIDAACQQVVNRVEDKIPAVEEFIQLRRDTSAVPMLYALIEYCMGLTLPNEVFDHPVIVALELAGNDILTWANDMYSFNKEQAKGDTQNLVVTTMHELNLGVQGAVDYVGDLIMRRIDDYVGYKDQLPSFGPDVNNQVKTYVAGIEDLVIAVLHWSFDCERYFGPQHAEIKEHRVVTLLPVDTSGLPEADSVFVGGALISSD